MLQHRRPLQFVPTNAGLSCFSGYVCVGQDEYKVCLRGVKYVNGSVSFDAAELDVEAPLAALLAAHKDTLKIRLMQSASLASFAMELEELIAMCTPANSVHQQPLPSAEYYTHLQEELDAIGWNHLLELREDLCTLELQSHDAANRPHAIRIHLPTVEVNNSFSAAAPASQVQCFVDAPDPFAVPLSTVSKGTKRPFVLKEILSAFNAFLKNYQEFWDVLDDIDAHTFVLEPHHPTRATGRRRIALEKFTSIQIEVDPAQPRAICELSFFGNDATVAPLREKWNDKALQWDESLTVRENLELILNVAFPSPKHVQTDEFAVECGICYCYRLEIDQPTTTDDVPESETTTQVAKQPLQTMIPDRLCENGNCNRPFHEKCLFDWLKALPTARQSFNTVFGECPYCREAISAKFLL